ncbi:MAG: siderophore-interacting protein, partial [Bacteroidota bacterium]
FRINETSFRHYTPSFYHQQQGVCDVLFFLHGLGPGSQWAEALTVGTNTKLMGPGGKMKYRSEQDLHFFFGDESSLGLCHNLQHTANMYGHSYRCLLELDAEHQHWPALISLHTDIVEKSEKEPAKESIQTIEGLSKEDWEKWKKATYYLTGRAKSIQKIRRALLGRGIPTKQILTYPYWADGKKGL